VTQQLTIHSVRIDKHSVKTWRAVCFNAEQKTFFDVTTLVCDVAILICDAETLVCDVALLICDV